MQLNYVTYEWNKSLLNKRSYQYCSLPWFKLGVDIFEHFSHLYSYLLVADYFEQVPCCKETNQSDGGTRD